MLICLSAFAVNGVGQDLLDFWQEMHLDRRIIHITYEDVFDYVFLQVFESTMWARFS